MERSVEFRLNNVSPTPASLRLRPHVDAPASETTVNLGNLFLQYYFDSYGTAAPKPDPSRFEYLDLVSAATDFRFHAHVTSASKVKRRSLATEIGQAFCRLMLAEHFAITHFAHLDEVMGKSAHGAFGGMRVERVCPGDVPDYLCARIAAGPFIAEAKGRFSSIGFHSAAFNNWRTQFTRIRVVDSSNVPRSAKGYIVATRLVTDADPTKNRTTSYIEDPNTEGEPLSEQDRSMLGRGAIAVHYARVFGKLGLLPVASALNLGYALPRQPTFQLPVWTCTSPPFQGRKYIGGYYQTVAGYTPTYTERGWQLSLELGAGHSVFIGLDADIASRVAQAARGEWEVLNAIEPVVPEGTWSSEFAWLFDGTVAAPLLYFIPTQVMIL